MECRYAIAGAGRGPVRCQILTDDGKSSALCGCQRYCPNKKKCVLTAEASGCTIKLRHETPAAARNGKKKTRKAAEE